MPSHNGTISTTSKPKRAGKKWTKARRIKAMWRMKPGRPLLEISEKVGCAPGYVSKILSDAGFDVARSQESFRAESRDEQITRAIEGAVENADLSVQAQALLGLLTAWAGDMSLFVEQALGINGESGYRMTTQQREACEWVSKLVRAKEAAAAGVDMTEEQRELAQKVGISIMSGQGPGKDAWLSWFIIWFLICFPKVLIPCTAPVADQLKNVLWTEVSRWLNLRDDKGKFLAIPLVRDRIRIQADKIFVKDPDSKNFAFPKTANPKDDSEAQARTLYGYHSPYMAIIVDEAAGVLEPVFKPLEGTLTGEVNFLVMVFNPIKSTGFAIESQIGKFAHKYIALRWNAEESENVSKQHIRDMAEKYGRNSNTYRTLVLGLPPKADPDTLIPYDWVMAAVDREIVPDKYDPMRGGLDPGGGGDNSVLTVRHGMKIVDIQTFSSPDTTEIVYWAAKIYDEHELDVLDIDNIGLGSGVYYQLKSLGYNVRPVDVRNTARDEDRFANKRAELWWKAREIFEAGTISIPDNQFLKEELWSPKFEKEARKISIEKKAVMKKRLESGRSPNYADSLLLTFDAPDAVYRKRRAFSIDDDDWGAESVEPAGWMAA